MVARKNNSSALEVKFDMFQKHLENHLERVDKSLVKVDHKVDELDKRLDRIENNGIKNTVVLEEHVRRTNLLEESLKKESERITPLETQSATFKMILKILVATGAVGGTSIGVGKLISLLLGE